MLFNRFPFLAYGEGCTCRLREDCGFACGLGRCNAQTRRERCQILGAICNCGVFPLDFNGSADAV